MNAAARRELLVEQSRQLRDTLAADASALRGGADSLDSRLSAAGSALARPLVIAALVALVVVRPRRIFRLAGKAAVLWPVVRPFAMPALRSVLPLVVERLGGGGREPDGRSARVRRSGTRRPR